MQSHRIPYELICVDDGSTDGSSDLLKKLVGDRPDLRAVLLRRNYGQTAAMAAGFFHAKGRAIVTLAQKPTRRIARPDGIGTASNSWRAPVRLRPLVRFSWTHRP